MRGYGVIACLAVCCAVCSCTMFTPPDRGDLVSGTLPDSYSVRGTEYPHVPSQGWWTAWSAPELDRLEAMALEGNLGLEEAWARLRQAEAVARKSGAPQWPEIGYSASASVSRTGEPAIPGQSTTVEDYALALAGSYEVDLWGRVRGAREAAIANARASREDLDAAVMTVSARIAELWVSLIGAREGIRLLEEQRATNEGVLELIELRFRKSLGSALDVYRQREAVARSAAPIPLVEARERTLLHEIAVLLGRPPGTEVCVETATLPGIVPLPVLGIPADLLAQRPDVRAARWRLASADWQVESARADTMPALRLTGRAGYGDDEMRDLLDNWLFSLAAGLTGPLFDAGRRGAEVDRARAEARQRLAAYREVVLQAIREVEDALVREDRQTEFIGRLEAQADAARVALQEARSQYLKGVVDYLSVLLELRAVQTIEQELVSARVDRLRYRIALHRALGGVWMADWTPAGTAISAASVGPDPAGDGSGSGMKGEEAP